MSCAWKSIILLIKRYSIIIHYPCPLSSASVHACELCNVYIVDRGVWKHTFWSLPLPTLVANKHYLKITHCQECQSIFTLDWILTIKCTNVLSTKLSIKPRPPKCCYNFFIVTLHVHVATSNLSGSVRNFPAMTQNLSRIGWLPRRPQSSTGAAPRDALDRAQRRSKLLGQSSAAAALRLRNTLAFLRIVSCTSALTCSASRFY